MNLLWSPTPAASARAPVVLYHPSATPVQMVTDTATDGVDLSQYVESARQTSQSLDVRFAFHKQLYGAAQPAPGRIMEVREEGLQLWWGIIDSISEYRLERGERALSVTVRSRDAHPHWRDVKRSTRLYPVGTPLAVIATDVATEAGMQVAEIQLPTFGAATVHSGTQLAQMSAWEMLTTLMQPGGYEPYVNANGALQVISRDITRAPDVTLTLDRIKSVQGSRQQSPLTAVRVKWLDPLLTKVSQQSQRLAGANVTAGFFQLEQNQDVWFSDDGSMRAENTFMQIKQSCNSGLLRVADENYAQVSEKHGRITLDTEAWVPGLVLVAMVGMFEASSIPDLVDGEVTIPVGRIVHAASELTILTVMASIGTGVYEIWGQPYDYVHARNEIEAYDETAPEWVTKVEEIETDFSPNEADATAYAVREFQYRARAASSWGVEIIDDRRIEPGDILQVPDGTRLYVTDYSRDLTHGAPAILQVQGFQVTGPTIGSGAA